MLWLLGEVCCSNVLNAGSPGDASVKDRNWVKRISWEDASETAWADANNPLGAGVEIKVDGGWIS